MKDLSAYYEIARLITAELSETITPEEKERLNVWLAEDERHYMRYCRIRERLKRGECIPESGTCPGGYGKTEKEIVRK